MTDAQAEAKKSLLLKYSNRWLWDIFMKDSRTFAVGIELAKYGHFTKQKWLVILYVLAKDRGEKQWAKKRKENAYCPWSISKFIC